MNRALVIQTAFLGDVILTLPLVQVLKRTNSQLMIDFVAIPAAKEVLANHPDISNVIIYDKHGDQKSLFAFSELGRLLRANKYDLVLCPHPSFRSSMMARATKAGVRIGFDRSAWKNNFTSILPWRFGVHEIDRNLSLLRPLGIDAARELPRLYPSDSDREKANAFMKLNGIAGRFAVVAPGTVWKTKQFPVRKMAEVADKLRGKFERVVLVGGVNDSRANDDFSDADNYVVSAIGKLPIMSSAEIIRRASLLISNDSAPVHIASAFSVPTVAIFGPTVRDFGFYPYHDKSAVVEVKNLSCRPCSIHGGKNCPIETFDCMEMIQSDDVATVAFLLTGGGNV